MHCGGADCDRKLVGISNVTPYAVSGVAWLALLLVSPEAVLTGCVLHETRIAAGAEYEITVDLTKKDTIVPLPGKSSDADTCVVVVQVEALPSPYRLFPAHGMASVGQSVDIVLDKASEVSIRLSLITRGDQLAVKVSPRIGLERGMPVDFTLERVRRTAWTLQRRVKELQRQVAAARKEYELIDTWLATPGNKPLDQVKAARLRQRLLQREIVACQRDLPFVQKRYAGLGKIAQLAQQIHGATVIHFTIQRQRQKEQ